MLAWIGRHAVFRLRGDAAPIQNAAAVLDIGTHGGLSRFKLGRSGVHVLRAVELGRVIVTHLHVGLQIDFYLTVDLGGRRRAPLLVAVVHLALCSLSAHGLVAQLPIHVLVLALAIALNQCRVGS